MKALLDIGETQWSALCEDVRPLVAGQLLTPLTGYSRWSDYFAIDNGAFSGFRRDAFKALLDREKEHAKKCLFVCVPDVVGDGRRTLEIFYGRHTFIPREWPVAFVCQDGSENHAICWDAIAAVFIGGTTHWKMSQHATAIIKCAKILGKHVHIGRVNTPERWNHFEKLGADTCDGSGLSMYDHMLKRIASRDDHPLLDASDLVLANALTNHNA